jgi:hypothetical protein
MRRPLVVLVALALACGLAACGSSKKKAAPAQEPVATSIPGPPIAPLTGLPDPNRVAEKRCAITVKIDNTNAGRPKYGVEQADDVYEEVVEGGYTRLAAIFNSNAPAKVGSVRSVRKTDQSIVWPIGGIFAYSGGAQYAIDSINTAPVVQLDENRAGSTMFRDPSRLEPYNLYAHLDQMYGRCGKPVPPPPLFSYRGATTAPMIGDAISSAHVGFLGQFAVTWTWDAGTGRWKRAVDGRREITASGTQIAPMNVVVMFVQYVGGDAHGVQAEATLTGSGQAWVLTDGKVLKGTWSRPDKKQPAQLLDATGTPILLTPGQTWIELPDASYQVTTTP